MDLTEKYLYHYRKLMELLEDDLANISACMEGELLEQYRSMLKREIEIMKTVRKY